MQMNCIFNFKMESFNKNLSTISDRKWQLHFFLPLSHLNIYDYKQTNINKNVTNHLHIYKKKT